MDFETLAPIDAVGWRLAHSVIVSGRRIPKSSLVTKILAKNMAVDNILQVQAFRLGPDDVGEDDIGNIVAASISGDNIVATNAMRGRVDLRASKAGKLSIGTDFDAVNKIDEGLTVATLARDTIVHENDLIATIKIIPYALPNQVVDKIKTHGPILNIQPFQAYKVALINSDKAEVNTAITDRITVTAGHPEKKARCSHDVDSLKNTMIECTQDPDIDLVLIIGKSAIVDRRDTIPTALEIAGGNVRHLGMPADPGNLLMLGDLRGKPVVGVPSCAKSPARNGFDMVLEDFAIHRTVSKASLQAAGIGGLLKSRPSNTKDRQIHSNKRTDGHSNTAILLAAGASTRASVNKILAKINGQTVANIAAQNIAKAQSINPANIVVVTGRDAIDVEASIDIASVHFVVNPNFDLGIASSLRCGLMGIDGDAELILLALADMPFVKPDTIDILFNTAKNYPGDNIFVPTFNGKRGNPVLWRGSLLADLRNLEGDMGGKQLMEKHIDTIRFVSVNDPGVLIDLDTQEALAQFGAV